MTTVIKTPKDYEAALGEAEKLLARDPDPGTPAAERLELFSLLVRDYEAKTFPRELPDPVDAVLFRMEQQQLTPRDLIPFLGSRSKVSEVFSRKRPLTLAMIRALHAHLGIPAEVLIQKSDGSEESSGPAVEWDRFPIREMAARGWIPSKSADLRNHAEKILREFFGALGPVRELAVLYRKTDRVRSARSVDFHSLAAWSARIALQGREATLNGKFHPGSVDLPFLREVARLSWSETGPLLAREYLAKHGIALIVEPHLPHTHLDGAAILVKAERPVIGMTLRHDRLDNFWFCLLHELSHLSLHLNEESVRFFDDLDVEDKDLREVEADELAGEALIPQDAWKRSPASRLRSPEAAEHLAKQLGIHPAIVAGRMRHEFKAFRLLNHLVGHRQVRRHFPELQWPE